MKLSASKQGSGTADQVLGFELAPVPADPWLTRWLPLITQRTAGAPVLELGCGDGDDSEVLAANGLSVVGIDLREEALAVARTRVPTGVFVHQDLRSPFPPGPGSVGVVVASLCLHYFPWSETEGFIGRIHETLRPDGLLLCRLNSTNDSNHGSSGFPRISEHYYSVHGHPKRFFDERAARHLFRLGWHPLGVEELTILKYEKPKCVWEIVVAKAA